MRGASLCRTRMNFQKVVESGPWGPWSSFAISLLWPILFLSCEAVVLEMARTDQLCGDLLCWIATFSPFILRWAEPFYGAATPRE